MFFALYGIAQKHSGVTVGGRGADTPNIPCPVTPPPPRRKNAMYNLKVGGKIQIPLPCKNCLINTYNCISYNNLTHVLVYFSYNVNVQHNMSAGLVGSCAMVDALSIIHAWIKHVSYPLHVMYPTKASPSISTVDINLTY